MPLNILTFNWHEPYICLLAKTGHFFEVVLRLKGGRKEWLVEQRPVPENIILISEDHALRKCYCHFYDIIICQNIDDLLLVKDIEIPKILIFHNKLSTEIALGGNTISKEDYLKQVKLLIEQSEPIKLLFISQTKKMDWGLEGYVITPGIDPNEFENYQGHWPKVLRVGNFLKERDIMMGFSLQEEILKGIPSTILGLNPTLPNARFSRSFEDLKKNYSRHRLYLNTTVEDYEDGYNLATLEAMATGMPIVSIANRTSPIIDGVNGYISDNIEYLRERIRMLLMDKGLAKRIGKEARNTVVEKFGIKEFLKKWNEVIEDSVNNGKRLKAENDKRLKVLLSYTSNPQTTAAYIEKAMRKICDVITYGPSISKETLIRWNLLAIEDKVKEHQIPFIDGDLKKVFKQLPLGWKPDVFLYIDTGISYPLINLDAIKCIKSCYLIDTHLNLEKHIEIAKNFDVVFIAQKADVKRFKERGIKNVFWIPLACDPEIHGKKTNNKLYDIGFVGSLTDPKRVELLDKLKRRFNLYYERCFLERMAEVFSQSKIVFNKSIKNDLNMRVFEAMASGSMLLTDEAKGSGLTEMFQDRKHLVIYRDEKELFELADYYLRNDDEREKIAKQGMTKVLDRHTYAHRVQEMINIIKDRNNAKEEIRILGDSKDEITSDAIKFYEKYWKEGTQISKETISRYQTIINQIFSEKPEGKRILEIGVGGEGGIIIHLKKDNDVYGLDASVSAQKNCERLGLKIKLANVDKETLPFDNEFFDVVFAFEVFEHLANPQFVLEEIRRVLKENGLCVISTPNPLIHHWPRLFYPQLFEEKAFREFLMVNKFHVLRIFGYGQNVYQSILPDGNAKAWSWLWHCQKLSQSNMGTVLLEYGKYFLEQKNELEIRIRPREAIDMVRMRSETGTDNEARFYLTRSLFYRYIYGEKNEFEQNLKFMLKCAAQNNHPDRIKALCHLSVLYIETRRFGINITHENMFNQILRAIVTIPEAKSYLDKISKESGITEFEQLTQMMSHRDQTDGKSTTHPSPEKREPLDIDYYRQERKDVEALIPKEARKILDVGCGEGILGKRLLEKGVKEVVGVEIEQAVCEKTRENLSMVICGDIEEIDLPFEERYFDCIVFADILEHLKDPLSVIKKLKKHLKDSGVVVASIPNVRYYQVINMLVDGHWTYGDYGILDRTHLRFFTKKEILALFKNAGFEITTITGNVDPKYYTVCNSTPAEISFGRISLKDLSSEEIKDLFVFQYLIKAKKDI